MNWNSSNIDRQVTIPIEFIWSKLSVEIFAHYLSISSLDYADGEIIENANASSWIGQFILLIFYSSVTLLSLSSAQAGIFCNDIIFCCCHNQIDSVVVC